MAKKTYSGIYCIESAWPDRGTTSARPMIELLADYHEIPYIHRIAMNAKQFECRLRQWKVEDMRFSILYLWYHGSAGSISPAGDDEFTLDKIGCILKGSCSNCLIHFGSCETLNIDHEKIGLFLQRTGAVAVSGYRKAVGWIEPIALELQYLKFLQDEISSSGNRKFIDKKVVDRVRCKLNGGSISKLLKELDFVISTQATPTKR